jgi:hypothetical protein
MIGLLGASFSYQKLLDSEYSEHPYINELWVQVAGGVALTSLWVALEDPRAATRMLRCFAISGLPFIVRGLLDMHYDDLAARVIGED